MLPRPLTLNLLGGNIVSMPSEDAPQVQIRRLDEDDPAALFRLYRPYEPPQDCFVSLDLRDGELTADWNVETGSNAVPGTVHSGQVLRWEIPCLTTAAANQLLADLAPAAQRVLDGAEIAWDGDNTVGHLDGPAADAAGEIADDCAMLGGGYARVVGYNAADWYSEGETPAVTAAMLDEELAALAEQLQADDGGADSGQTVTDNPGDYVVITGLDEYLVGLRATAREVAELELAEVRDAVDEATARRDQLIRDMTWKSSREVGLLAGLSHTRVQQIAKWWD
jgi:hypothetical protein